MSEAAATPAARAAFEPYLPKLAIDWGDGPFARELEGSLVSVDLTGFTALSERLAAKGKVGAEELILLISGVYEGLIRVAGRVGGDVLKFRGDALLIFFGGEGHEQRACIAADEMQWLIDETGRTNSSVGPVTLSMTTGIYSGPCNFFVVEGSHRELIVTGPAATETIRLESAAETRQILVSNATAAALDPGWVGGEQDGARILRRGLEGRELVTAPLEEPRERDLTSLLPVTLRAVLAAGAAEPEHRHATAAFLKFSGVDDRIRERGHEDLLTSLQALAEVVGNVTTELSITWLESDIDVDGGKLYLTAGAPSSSGGDEERMLRALRVIVDADVGLTLRAGVNRGPVFAGEIGASMRKTYAVMGDTVNLAARLAARARPGQILSTGDVLDRSHTLFESEAQPFLMKGKERAVTAYSVGAMLGPREETRERLPLIGRDEELAALRAAVDAARMRQARVVELVGEPGIGKSRLVEELGVLALGFTQLVGRCEVYATAAPYFVFRPLLRQLAGVVPGASSVEAGEQLTAWVHAVMPDEAPWLPLLAAAFDATVAPSPEAESIEPAFRRERLHDAVDQFLTRVLMMPTVLVIEDAHWIDDASRDLLTHLAAPAPRPWLICVTRRLEGLPVAPGDAAHVVRLELEPLHADAAAALALAAAQEVALSEDALAALTARSAGNPLFVRELVAAARGHDLDAALPESVELLMTARIDRLDAGDRLLLRYASVVGPQFDLELLREILVDDAEDAGELERWERLSDFVEREGDDLLRFRHDLFRVAAYEGLSYGRRRAIHGRVGAVLERRAGEDTDEAAGLLSLHFLEAGEHEQAWRYSVAAGDRARTRYANADAVEFYERALAAAGSLELDAAEVARVGEALGDVAELAARYDEASDAYTAARSLLPDGGPANARLMLKSGILRERTGEYDEALRWYVRALRSARALEEGDAQATRIELELAYAGVRHRQGRFADAVRWAKRAARDAEEAGDRRALGHAYLLLYIGHTRLGQPDPSWAEQALPIYEEVDDPLRQASLLNNLGNAAHLEGRWEEAVEWYGQSVEVYGRAGDVVNKATPSANSGELLCDQGHHERAEELLRDALRVWRAAGYAVGVGVAGGNLAQVAARSGRFADAHTLLDGALEELEKIGARGVIVEVTAVLVECLVLEGRHEEARALAEETLRRAAEVGLGAPRARLERLLGYALHQARRPDEARPHFDESVRIARELGADYELALTLKALADTGADGGAERAEAQEIFDRLGVVSTPRVPLP